MSAPGTTIPGIMIGFYDGDLIASTVAGGDSVTGTVGPSIQISREDRIAGFSSRGPNGGARDIIKPDVTAPGVQILAAHTPTPNDGKPPGRLFQSISGTSMASPHVAGIGALILQKHPDWTPAMVRSALMTTARQDMLKTFGPDPADPFDIGAGHIVPEKALDPGLVYDVGLFEYAAFTCGADGQPPIFTPGTCAFLASLGLSFDSSDLNLPSIGVADLAGSQIVIRTVTSIKKGKKKKWRVSVDMPPGIDVSVNPTSLDLKKGESATYDVTFTNAGAPLDEWAFGSLTWKSGKTRVRSPIAIRPVLFSAPGGVSGMGTMGSLDYDVGIGFSGSFSATPEGLVPAILNFGNVVDDPANDINEALATGIGVTFEPVVIPAGTNYARFALFDEDTDGNDDLDLYIFGPDTDGFPFVGGSGNANSDEEVNVMNPAPGTYLAVVHGFETDGPDANYILSSWSMGLDLGNMAVSAPSTVSFGLETVSINWTGLLAGHRYLGRVVHVNGGAGVLKPTVVSIDTR